MSGDLLLETTMVETGQTAIEPRSPPPLVVPFSALASVMASAVSTVGG